MKNESEIKKPIVKGYFIVRDKDGRIKYDNWDDLPPEVQKLVQQEEYNAYLGNIRP